MQALTHIDWITEKNVAEYCIPDESLVLFHWELFITMQVRLRLNCFQVINCSKYWKSPEKTSWSNSVQPRLRCPDLQTSSRPVNYMQSVCKCMLIEVENMHAECTVLSNVLDCLLRFSSRIVIRCWGDSRNIRKGGQPTLIISQAGWKFAVLLMFHPSIHYH